MKRLNELVPFFAFLLLAYAAPSINSSPNRGYGYGDRDRSGSTGSNFSDKDKGYKIVIKLDDAFGKVADDFEILKELAVDMKLMKVLLEEIVPDIKELKKIVPEIRTISETTPDLMLLRQISNMSPSEITQNTTANRHRNNWELSLPKSHCAEIRLRGEKKSGLFMIQPDRTSKPIEVYCDMQEDGGGWTVVQRRGVLNLPKNMREDFFRNWEDYENGFGNARSDYWLGLENIHTLTRDCNNELLINLTAWNGASTYAKYSRFNISGKADFYRLSVSGYSGNAGDALVHHNKMRFTTYDKQNDLNGEDNCARLYKGAWWYKDCFWSNLNGEYANDGTNGKMESRTGIEWGSAGHFYSFMKTEIKIRPKC